MKKILLSLLLLFTITLIQAQIKKGTHFLGGSLGISIEKTATDTSADLVSNAFYFTPAYGRAIMDNLIFGGDLIVLTSKYESIYSKEERQSYGADIFLRKYMDLGKKFYLFVEGRFGGYSEKVDGTYLSKGYNSKGFTIQASLYPGVAFAVTKKFHIETGFNNLLFAKYSFLRTHDTGSLINAETSRFSIGSSLSSFNGFVVGFRFVLG